MSEGDEYSGLRKVLIYVVTIGILGAFVVVNIQRYLDRQEVVKDHSFAVGRIVSYSKIGTHRNRLLTYSYEVNGRTYTRDISSDVDFPECIGNIKLCSDKRFSVIYSNSDHSKSLINMHREFGIGFEGEFSSTFEKFQ